MKISAGTDSLLLKCSGRFLEKKDCSGFAFYISVVLEAKGWTQGAVWSDLKWGKRVKLKVNTVKLRENPIFVDMNSFKFSTQNIPLNEVWLEPPQDADTIK